METLIEPVTMSPSKDIAQELKLKNLNNCLACDAFVYITVAPSRRIVDADFEKVFFTWHEGRQVFFKMVDMLRFDFARMPSIATLPATGMEGIEWCNWYQQDHPDVQKDTLMAVYYYKKILM